MPVPVLLVTGFLGAGKTTLVNHLLAQAAGRRIAAVVNDFGAINIDAELIAGASDGVVSLANGCICCTLEGDLLRTLSGLLRRTPRPEAIVIETSGVADPADIVRNLMDPVVWREAPLETVLCVVDAVGTVGLDDALLRAQVRAADVVVLNKLDLADAAAQERLRAAVAAIKPGVIVTGAVAGQVPLDLLFPAVPDERRAVRDVGRARPISDRYETTSWVSEQPISLRRLQAAIGRMAARLVRAKGFVETVERPGQVLLLQYAAGRAAMSAVAASDAGAPPVRIVFITEIGAFGAGEIERIMAGCLET
ncbi:MAG: GTP-binding protein [Proteobacteria bacterium]|nr:GTP-binding protein [Pseudomonadota bacterium]